MGSPWKPQRVGRSLPAGQSGASSRCHPCLFAFAAGAATRERGAPITGPVLGRLCLALRAAGSACMPVVSGAIPDRRLCFPLRPSLQLSLHFALQ